MRVFFCCAILCGLIAVAGCKESSGGGIKPTTKDGPKEPLPVMKPGGPPGAGGTKPGPKPD